MKLSGTFLVGSSVWLVVASGVESFAVPTNSRSSSSRMTTTVSLAAALKPPMSTESMMALDGETAKVYANSVQTTYGYVRTSLCAGLHVVPLFGTNQLSANVSLQRPVSLLTFAVFVFRLYFLFQFLFLMEICNKHVTYYYTTISVDFP